MKELDMIKAFAELEGLEFKQAELSPETILAKVGSYWFAYEPIENLSIVFMAMIDYKVQKIHSMVNSKKIMLSIRDSADVISVFDESEVPYAIIECILKSKGLWQ